MRLVAWSISLHTRALQSSRKLLFSFHILQNTMHVHNFHRVLSQARSWHNGLLTLFQGSMPFTGGHDRHISHRVSGMPHLIRQFQYKTDLKHPLPWLWLAVYHQHLPLKSHYTEHRIHFHRNHQWIIMSDCVNYKKMIEEHGKIILIAG